MKLAPGKKGMADPLHLLRDLDRVPRGVIHVGANVGQEFPAYQAAGFPWGVYIEALPSVMSGCA